MSDFASGVMLRLLLTGMAESGMIIPASSNRGTNARGVSNARVPLERKRALTAAVLAQGGHATLLQLGLGIHRLAGDPIHLALGSACDPHDFLARWHRLERYMHSRHRVEVLAVSPYALHLRHHTPHHAEGPAPEESLLVLGVIAAGFEMVGATALRVRIVGEQILPLADSDPAILTRLARDRNVAEWELDWAQTTKKGSEDVSGRFRVPRMNVPPQLCSALKWPQMARQIADDVLEDLSADHSVQAVARRLGTSGRSLQRQLAAHGLTLSNVLAETRSRAAAWWLCQADRPIAEVGFLCGFSDQPHFTREFTHRVGLAPARYRRESVSPERSPESGPVRTLEENRNVRQ